MQIQCFNEFPSGCFCVAHVIAVWSSRGIISVNLNLIEPVIMLSLFMLVLCFKIETFLKTHFSFITSYKIFEIWDLLPPQNFHWPSMWCRGFIRVSYWANGLVVRMILPVRSWPFRVKFFLQRSSVQMVLPACKKLPFCWKC